MTTPDALPDLRTMVKTIAPVHVEQMFTATDRGATEYRPDDCLYREDVLALIPPGAVLITEASLTLALKAVYAEAARDLSKPWPPLGMDTEFEDDAADLFARLRDTPAPDVKP